MTTPTSSGAIPGNALPTVVNGRLVGRDAEMSWLHAHLDVVRGGTAQAVLIGGEAGIGKTRLVSEFSQEISEQGIGVLAGGCLDRGDIPYAPMVAALRDELSRRGADQVRTLLPELGVSVLESLLPGRLVPSARHPPRSRPTSQTMIFESLLHLLETLARSSPVVLVLEDMHWADQSSLDLLSFLVRSLREHPVLVVATYRSSDLLPDHPLRPLLGELSRLPRCSRLDLQPLSTSAVETLLSDLIGARTGDPAVHRIVQQAAGNPFFVEELALTPAVSLVLPDSVREHVLARVELLDHDSREVVSAAAVHDSTIGHSVLAEVSQLPADRLERALDSCFAHHLLDQDSSGHGYRFRHPLTREAVYRQLLPGRRLRLHAAVARTLERRTTGSYQTRPAAADLAHHWWEADAPAQALRWSLLAAESAAAVFAVSEAVHWYDRVLQFWPAVDAADRPCEPSYDVILLRAADAQRWAGNLDAAIDYLDAALELLGNTPDVEQRAQLLERKGRFLWETGSGAASLTAYEQACALIRDRPASPATAWVLAGHGTALMQGGQHREAIAQCREALEVADLAGAQAEQGRALNTLGVCLALTGEPDQGIAALRLAASLATAARSPEEIHRAYANLAYVLEGAGHLVPALAAARKGSASSRALAGNLSGSGVLTINAASVLVMLGRWAEADDQLSEARASVSAQAYIAIVQAEADIARGRWARAAEQLRVARGSGLFDSEPQFAGAVLAAQAEMALWQRDPLAALHAVRDGLDALHGSQEAACELRLCWLGARAAADARLTPDPGPAPIRDREHPSGVPDRGEDTGLAERLLERMRVLRGDPILKTLPDPAAHAQACLAELARWRGDADAGMWEDVANAWTSLHRPYPAAYARFRAGEVALAGRDHVRATSVLEAASAESERLGAQPLHQEIEGLAARGRIRLAPAPPREPSRSPYGLTRREREVLAQLVLGRTNRQIARTLFISEKTAGTHVSNLMAKLGVANRGEAAAVAHRLKLVPEPGSVQSSP